MAKYIMPSCNRIFVYEGDDLDIEYRVVGKGKWECFEYPPMNKPPALSGSGACGAR